MLRVMRENEAVAKRVQRQNETTRLPGISAAAAVGALPAAGQQRKKIAALSTTYHVRSHTDNFVTRFLEGYWIDEKYYASPADIVSLYMDQIHPGRHRGTGCRRRTISA